MTKEKLKNQALQGFYTLARKEKYQEFSKKFTTFADFNFYLETLTTLLSSMECQLLHPEIDCKVLMFDFFEIEKCPFAVFWLSDIENLIGNN